MAWAWETRFVYLTGFLLSAGVWLSSADTFSQTNSVLSESSHGVTPSAVSTSVSVIKNATISVENKGSYSKESNILTDFETNTVYSATAESTIRENRKSVSSQIPILFRSVVLTLQDFTECVTASHSLKFYTNSAVVDIRIEVGDRIPPLSRCELQLTAPDNTIFFINGTTLTAQRASLQLLLSDVGGSYSRRLMNCCDSDIPGELWAYTNIVRMMLQVTSESQAARVALNFTAVSASERPRLEVVFISQNRGYIQTPKWSVGREYPALMDSWVKLDAPDLSSAMLSAPRMDVEGDSATVCPRDGLELYVNRISNQSYWTRCRNAPLSPRLYQASALYVHFYSNEYGKNTGFRLLFTFHNRSAVPTSLSDGRWNCSSVNWTEFQDHFPCNLKSDCVGSEDEAACPYTSVRCGLGQPSFQSSCYIWEKPSTASITWKEAFAFCLARGARLASLNTPAEWNNVLSLLSLASWLIGQYVYVGLLQMFQLRQMYLNAFQWSDGSIAYYMPLTGQVYMPGCGVFPFDNFTQGVKLRECDAPKVAYVLCEIEEKPNVQLGLPQVTFLNASFWRYDITRVVCPQGHVTHSFLSCDVATACWVLDSFSTCAAPLSALPPAFDCLSGVEQVPYTLVCDHRPDCSDNSDESFCEFASCYNKATYDCGNFQCISEDQRCDGVEQCITGADEAKCLQRNIVAQLLLPPAIVDLDSKGQLVVKSLQPRLSPSSQQYAVCPDTHFQCPGMQYFCLPVYLRCNDVYDCPNHSDEAECDTYTCPGLYRCRASRVCLHPDHLCDGFNQCPQHDDELTCGLTCPDSCTCFGLAFTCRNAIAVHLYPDLRYLNAGGSGTTLGSVRTNKFLIYLSLANCNLEKIEELALPNLCTLDLTGNKLTSIQSGQLENVPNLQTLKLAGNPLISIFAGTPNIFSFPRLLHLDLSQVRMNTIDPSIFSMFTNLDILNLSDSGVDIVSDRGFHTLPRLRSLDLRGCSVQVFPLDLLHGLDRLGAVYTDNYKLCCPAMLPEKFNPVNCRSPRDEISSCDALLRSDFYRAILVVFATMAVLGNVCSFLYRVFLERTVSQFCFAVFVIHLNVSDFIMGVYLVMIGVADWVYQGTYLWNDLAWRRSGACKMAGFLSLLASEVSAFIVCLITLDRFIVLRFPFVKFRFTRTWAHLACVLAWVAGLTLASVPLLPATSHWQFYGHTGICIPLPLTRSDYAGHEYSFQVLMVLNFVLFMLIALGQAFVFWSIRANSLSVSDTTKKSNDLTIARRLLSVVVTDFLCRFPIGFLALLASQGVAIPGEVNVAIAVAVLPVNSALNPFLYTLSTLQERRRRQREARRMKLYLSRLSKTSMMTMESTACAKQ